MGTHPIFESDFDCLTEMVQTQGSFIATLEDTADKVLRRSKHILPHVARFFLVSTFIEDGIRMYYQWGEQRDYIDSSWNCGTFFSDNFRCSKSFCPTRRRNHGSGSKKCPRSLCCIILYYFSPNSCLSDFVGYEVFGRKLSPLWCGMSSACRSH